MSESTTASTQDSAKLYFRKNLKKFLGTQDREAGAFRDGVESGLCAVLTTGDDVFWTELAYRKDGNGQLSWYIDLFSCSQAQHMADMAQDEDS